MARKQKKRRKVKSVGKARTKRIRRQQVHVVMPSAEEMNASYNQGYNHGFDKGHDAGYEKGRYDGGDGIVDQFMPDAMVLPGIPIEQIIAKGLEGLQHEFVKVMATDETVRHIVHALDHRQPFSLVRLGDGELLTMSQDILKSREELERYRSFLEYAGVTIPNLEARDQLVSSVKAASLTGIPLLRVPNYQNLAFEVFRAYGIDYRQKKLTHSTINYAVYLEHRLPDLLNGRRVLTVGNKAVGLAEVFAAAGLSVAGAISPVMGMSDIPRVMEEAARMQFDIAIISAGIPSVVIAQRMADELGKVAIDFGHLADSMVSGESPYR